MQISLISSDSFHLPIQINQTICLVKVRSNQSGIGSYALSNNSRAISSVSGTKVIISSTPLSLSYIAR